MPCNRLRRSTSSRSRWRGLSSRVKGESGQMEGICLQRISFAGFVCYLGGRAAPGDQGNDMHSDVTAEEVLRAEDLRYAAQMGGDFAALERLYGDELVYDNSWARALPSSRVTVSATDPGPVGTTRRIGWVR